MTCPRENECIRAANTEMMPPELAGHIKQCAACAEAVRIAEALNSTTTEALIEPADARILWLLAAERRYAIAEQRLARLTRLLALVVGIVVVAATAIRAMISGGSQVDGLLGASAKVGPVFLIALAFVIVVVWTSPGRRART